jgi:small subunit ribosomal protein S13
MVLRIAGVYIPGKKVVGLGLTEIFGIGKATALRVLSEAEVSPEKKSRSIERGRGQKNPVGGL